MTINNFRQFHGTQQIEFASEVRNNGKNVTVVFGENGRGKTSLFRAIVFALYGERRLSQDEDVEQKELYLINSAAMEQSKKANKPVEAFVRLVFMHKDEKYEIKRVMIGILDGTDRIEQIDSVALAHTNLEGNTLNYRDPEEIQRIINSILDRNLKEYFFFDGEKIQRLTLASIEQRREVAKGIKNLLKLETIEKAIKALLKLKKELNTELGKRATGEYAKIISQIIQLDEMRAALKKKMEELEVEGISLNKEKKKIDKLLEEYKEIFHLLKDRSETESLLKSQEELGRNLIAEMKTKTSKISQLLISDTIDYVFDAIDDRKQKGEIPSEIRKDLIEKILDIDHKCICDRPVLPGTPEHSALIRWKNKVSDVEIDDTALEMWRELSNLKSHRDDTAGVVETLLQKYAVCRNEIDRLRKKIESLNEQIGCSERQDAAELEKVREKIENKQIEIEAGRMQTRAEFETVEDEYTKLIEKRKILEKTEKLKSELSLRANLAEETYTALQAMYNKFTDEIKQKITNEANQYFSQLLDKEGRETLKRILVNNDYSLQILDWLGKPTLANIGAGQRQIMSISFIAALAKVASIDSILEMPLFMDTPFGRLSYEHRSNLINYLPKYCAQWVLLATDTEFRKQEASLLIDTKRWGKFYVLKSKGPGVTKIEQRNVVDAFSMLKDQAED